MTEIILTVDCEGPKSDENIPANAVFLTDTVKRLDEFGVNVVAFITPGFAEAAGRKLLDKLLSCSNVTAGMHIHVEDLPDTVLKGVDFMPGENELLANYSYEEQFKLIRGSMDFLTGRYELDIQGFRGGFFSMDDNTARILAQYKNIRFESHNPYRSEYRVKTHILEPLPVMASDAQHELRIERFELGELLRLYDRLAAFRTKKVAITHSHLFSNERHVKKLTDFFKIVTSSLNN